MKRTIGTCVAAGLTALALQARAAQLDSSKWTVTALGMEQPAIKEVTDNNLDTCWTNAGGKGLLVDLGQVAVLHRIYFTPGAGVTNGYAQAKLSFLRTPEDTQGVTRVYHSITCEWWKVSEQRRKLQVKGEDLLPDNKADVDLKFDPIPARYLRIEGVTPIAEIELYGSLDKAAGEKRDAVVVRTNAPDVLRVAAEDLRYYIGELTGRPLPIVAPEQEAEYPGTLYKIVDLAAFARTYDEMVANSRAGRLPNGAAKPEFVTCPQGRNSATAG